MTIKRIFHNYLKWECNKNGFFNETHSEYNKEECEYLFSEYFLDLDNFDRTISKIFNEWKYSCEHFLTNKSFNRVAWLGQCCVCYDLKVPSKFKGGYKLLSKEQQEAANNLAKKRIEEWQNEYGRKN